MRYFAVLSLLVAVACASYLRPQNLSPECENAHGGSYLRPQAPTLCNECCDRCWAMHFNATVVDGTATNTPYCSSTGEGCPVWVFLRISACCNCKGQEISARTTECGLDGNHTTVSQSESNCQVANMTVLIGENNIRSTQIFGCAEDEDYLSKYSWISEADNEEHTVLVVGTCGDTAGGAGLQFVFDKYHEGTRFPDQCFFDKNFVSSADTDFEGFFASSLNVFGNAAPGNHWLVANFSSNPPNPIPCSGLDDLLDEQCAPNAPTTVAATYIVDQIKPNVGRRHKKVAEVAVETFEDLAEEVAAETFAYLAEEVAAETVEDSAEEVAAETVADSGKSARFSKFQ